MLLVLLLVYWGCVLCFICWLFLLVLYYWYWGLFILFGILINLKLGCIGWVVLEYFFMVCIFGWIENEKNYENCNDSCLFREWGDW